MYQPRLFKEDRIDILHQLIHDYPFATLVTSCSDGLNVDHIPLLLAADNQTHHGVLQGHLARPNPLVDKIADGLDAIAVFQGPQSYITPSWYPSKQQHGKVVPTWNYAVVHVTAKLTLKDDARWLHGLVSRLTNHLEQQRTEPWKVSDAPEEFIEQQLKAIVGIELEITDIEGKWKVSQNKTAEDRTGVSDGLAREQRSSPMSSLVANHDHKQ